MVPPSRRLLELALPPGDDAQIGEDWGDFAGVVSRAGGAEAALVELSGAIEVAGHVADQPALFERAR